MHPTELILNDIKNRLDLNVQNIKSILWVDAKLDIEDLPLITITSAGESLEDYHYNHYIVDLDVELKFMAVDGGFNRHTDAILQSMKDADAIIKRLSDRLPDIMKIDQISGTNLAESIDLERNLLVASRIYRITYKRTRGLN
jgi:hypothetical protein